MNPDLVRHECFYGILVHLFDYIALLSDNVIVCLHVSGCVVAPQLQMIKVTLDSYTLYQCSHLNNMWDITQSMQH